MESDRRVLDANGKQLYVLLSNVVSQYPWIEAGIAKSKLKSFPVTRLLNRMMSIESHVVVDFYESSDDVYEEDEESSEFSSELPDTL